MWNSFNDNYELSSLFEKNTKDIISHALHLLTDTSHET